MMVVAVGMAMARPFLEPELPLGTVVEVSGDVLHPGIWAVVDSTVHEALLAAGGSVDGVADAPVPEGHRVHIEHGHARVLPPSNPLLVGLPVNINEAGAHALAAIPGIGPQTALAIVQERDQDGLFYEFEDLYRVRGVGPSAIAVLRPFITLGNPGPKPRPRLIDLNHADATTLERLPHIGPVTAARIVVDRDENGPYKDLGSLQRVKGIGPTTIRDLQGLAEAKP